MRVVLWLVVGLMASKVSFDVELGVEGFSCLLMRVVHIACNWIMMAS